MKKSKALIISAIIWTVLAVGFIILGFTLAGEDVLAWFNSKYAWMTYTFLLVYLIVVVVFIVIPMIKEKL